MTTPPTTQPAQEAQQAGPVALSARALGPDLARGFMLLFIALANTHYFLRGDSYRGGFPMDGSAVDSGVAWAISTFVDGRAFPMFGLLFGYGVAHIVRRNEALGLKMPKPKASPAARRPARTLAALSSVDGVSTPPPSSALPAHAPDAARDGDSLGLGIWPLRKLLWRRSLVLIVVGAVHCLLLYVGDILAAYGMLLVFGAFAVRWKDRWLLIVAGLFFLLNAFPAIDSAPIDTLAPDKAMLPPDLLAQFSERIIVQPLIMFLGPIGFACPFLIGLWAGRRRILEETEKYGVLLRVTAVVGLGAAVLCAQPAALIVAGVTDAPRDSVLQWLGPLHDAAGVLGGFGYAALIALIAHRIGQRRGPVVTAIAATGQRSMTCYLAQSPVWFLVFTPYLLDLSTTLTVTTTALLATATWIGTVLLADQMRRRDYRGPFELLVRRVTYRPRRA